MYNNNRRFGESRGGYGGGGRSFAPVNVGDEIELKIDETLVTLMDTLHGVHFTDVAKGLHQRIVKTVQKISGQTEPAQVYSFNPKKLTKKAELITDGLWQESLASNPPLTRHGSPRIRSSNMAFLGRISRKDITNRP